METDYKQNNINFLHPEDRQLFFSLSPIMISLFFGCVVPTAHKIDPDYKITVTRTVDDMIVGRSVSNSHAYCEEVKGGRAMDIRIKDMKPKMAQKLCDELNTTIAEVFGAISYSTGKRKFAVLEKDHIHLQIYPKLSLDTLQKLVTRGIIYTLLNKDSCKF